MMRDNKMTLHDILNYRNEMNPFAKMLHMETVEMREGYAKAVMPVGDELRNPQGAVHGGVLYTLADVAGGNAAASHGEWIATLDADFHYLRPALKLTSLTAEATELKFGKRVSVYDVKVSDQNGTVLASGTFTYASLGRKIEWNDSDKK